MAVEALVDWREEEGQLTPVAIGEGGERIPVAWTAQPGSQQVFLTCLVPELLYEGTRGPGKTDTLIIDFAQHTGPDDPNRDPSKPQWKGWGSEWRGILFRKTYPQLADVIAKTKKWFPLIFPDARFNEGKTTWTWPDGETLKLAYGAKEDDYWNYHGHQYPWIGFEELTTWADPGFYKKMMSCNRSPIRKIPRKFRATTNPYGPGHNWVKLRFRLPLAPGQVMGNVIWERDSDGKLLPPRAAIHGYLDENRILMTADPQYKARIRAAARNKAELEAWLHGSWDIIAGGMFDDIWNPQIHVVPNIEIPSSWRIDRSFDWGSSKPFSVGWWAESDGSDLRLPNGRLCSTVRGDLFRIAEWYGWTGEPNEGVRMLAVDITKGIIEREIRWGIHDRVSPGPADSSIFAVENGMSIAVDMQKPVLVNNRKLNGIRWLPADKRAGSRKTGWELMRKYMAGAIRNGLPREHPGLFICQRCEQFRRTVPVLPRDLDKDPDDVDTDAEDHVADEVRYRIRFAGQRTTSGRVKGMPS